MLPQDVGAGGPVRPRKPETTSIPSQPRPQQQGPSRNLLLAAVAADEYESFSDLLEEQPLRTRETLQEAGEPPDYVYFPTSGIISLLTVLEDGLMIELATVGREGMTGVPLFLAMGDANTALVSEVPGLALRMRATDFLGVSARCPSFASVVKRYAGTMFALVAQSAACNRAHDADARCARWLLMTHDQVGSDAFPITLEFLAQMLGVTRPQAASATTALAQGGLVSYHRGALTIKDRGALEKAACECYAVVREHYRHCLD